MIGGEGHKSLYGLPGEKGRGHRHYKDRGRSSSEFRGQHQDEPSIQFGCEIEVFGLHAIPG